MSSIYHSHRPEALSGFKTNAPRQWPHWKTSSLVCWTRRLWLVHHSQGGSQTPQRRCHVSMPGRHFYIGQHTTVSSTSRKLHGCKKYLKSNPNTSHSVSSWDPLHKTFSMTPSKPDALLFMFSAHNTTQEHETVLLADLNLVDINSADWDILDLQHYDPDLKIAFQWMTYGKELLIWWLRSECLALPQGYCGLSLVILQWRMISCIDGYAIHPLEVSCCKWWSRSV